MSQYKATNLKFKTGKVKIPTNIKDTKLFFFVQPGVKDPLETCGGKEIELSKDIDYFNGCKESSKEGDNDCKAGLGEGMWKASGNI